MKKALLMSMLVVSPLFASVSFGWIEKAPAQKSYSFKFKLKDNKFEYSRTAASYEEAFREAAQVCFNHYKGNRHVAEDEGLDIIDVCANPRS
jgi:hypothetical protein